MGDNYFRNLRTLARCQAAYDAMEPPEYYEDPEDEDEESNSDEEF